MQNPLIRFMVVWGIFFYSHSFWAESLGCRNNEGKWVDWWVLVKPPDTLEAYFYVDAEDTSHFKQLDSGLNSTAKGALASTLRHFYEGKKDKNLKYIVYNDQTDEGGGHSDYAHAKGFYTLDSESGFWLVHSIPKFPGAIYTAYQGLPASARSNGQVAACLSFKKSEANQIENQLSIMRPYVIESYPPTAPKEKEDLLAEEPFSSPSPIHTVKGEEWWSFSKNQSWNHDLYEQGLAPLWKASFLAETWRKGGRTMGNACSARYQIMNIKEIAVNEDEQWSSANDHSKWAVSFKSDNKVVCIADINRQISQKHRGGGAVCLENEGLWKLFFQMVKSYNSCK